MSGEKTCGTGRVPYSITRDGLIEIVISAIKRIFGEDLRALKWENIVQEAKLRIWLYNKWIDEAIVT